MQLLILFTRDPDKAGIPTPTDLRQAEFAMVRGLYLDDFVRQVWLHRDGPGACMIVEANSSDQAAEKLSALPLIRAGFLKKPTIIPLKPYAGFGPDSSLSGERP